MKINIINDEKNFKFLYIELYFPSIGKIDRFNEWTDQYFSGFKIRISLGGKAIFVQSGEK